MEPKGQITITKSQIPNNNQFLNSNYQSLDFDDENIWLLVLGHWNFGKIVLIVSGVI